LSPGSATAVAAPGSAPGRVAARSRGRSGVGESSTARSAARHPPTRAEPPVATVAGGLLWAGALCAATAVSPLAAAAVVTPVGLVAGLSTARAVSRRRRTRRPAAVAATTAVILTTLLPAVALAGLPAAAGAAVVGALVAAAVSFYVVPAERPWALTYALIAPGAACGSVVVASVQGWKLGLTLVATVCAYDFACWVNGTRRGAGGPAGMIAGMLTVGAAGLFVAAVFVPPFSGWRPWAMFGPVGVLCIAGVALAGKAAGSARLPALRRIDSLVLAGPLWVAGVSVLLHR
jgi:hypothetical protein